MRWWYALVDAFVPIVVTGVIHGMMLLMLLINWNSVIPDYYDAVRPTQVISAKLVSIDAVTRSAPNPSQSSTIPNRPTRQELSESSRSINTAPIDTSIQASKPTVTPQPNRVKRTVKPEAATSPMTTQELAQLARADIDRAMAAEAGASEQDVAASYTALIRQTVVNYWSRPPSARNGMQVVLQLQLIPTGDIVGVTVLQSSGDSAFDRSAVNAVEKAARFPELQKLPPREFEKTFRRFRLLFKPEDLRY